MSLVIETIAKLVGRGSRQVSLKAMSIIYGGMRVAESMIGSEAWMIGSSRPGSKLLQQSHLCQQKDCLVGDDGLAIREQP
jgi:hypothetical protein